MKYFYLRLWIQNLFLIRRLNVDFSSELKEQQCQSSNNVQAIDASCQGYVYALSLASDQVQETAEN